MASGNGSSGAVSFGKGYQDTSSANQSLKSGGIVKKTFLPKVLKQKLNSIGGANS